MSTVLARTGAVVFGAIATLGLLLAVSALARGLPDRVAIFVAVTVIASLLVGVLMRREARRRRARDAQLAPPERPVRRVPRRPITFPVRETAIAFAFWYVVAVAIDRAVSGETTFFTVAAIAPFAAFMLTTLTIAGRHMAFRLTAEEAAGDDAGGLSEQSDTKP